jgi:hypothetical protein
MLHTLKRRCPKGILAVGALAATLALAAHGAISAPPNHNAARKANGPASPYSMGYSQISLGASAGGSSRYSVEDVITAASCDGASQSKGRYSVTSPLAVPATAPHKQSLNVSQWSLY